MMKVEEIQDALSQLSPEELTRFREWYVEWEAQLWDQQLEADVQAGKLDQRAEEAIRAYQQGDYTEL